MPYVAGSPHPQGAEEDYTYTSVEIREDLNDLLERFQDAGVSKKRVINYALRRFAKEDREQIVKDLAVSKAEAVGLLPSEKGEEEETEEGGA